MMASEVNSCGAARSGLTSSIKSSVMEMAVDLWDDDFPISTTQICGAMFHEPASTYTNRDSEAEIASNAPHNRNGSGQSVNSCAYSRYRSVNRSLIDDCQQ